MNQCHDTESVLSILGRRNALAHKQSRRFLQLFGLRLSRFWHPITGFDIVAFDDVIQPGRNQSLRDCLQVRYGEAAVQMIEDLIGL